MFEDFGFGRYPVRLDVRIANHWL